MYISLLLVVTIYCFFFWSWNEMNVRDMFLWLSLTWPGDLILFTWIPSKWNSTLWVRIMCKVVTLFFVWEYNTSFIILGPFCCSFMLLHSIQFLFSSFLGSEDYPKNNINFVLKPTLIDGSPNNKIMQLVKTIVVEVTWQLIVLYNVTRVWEIVGWRGKTIYDVLWVESRSWLKMNTLSKYEIVVF